MLTSFLLLCGTLAAGVVGVWENLTGQDRKRRVIAAISAGIVLVMVVVQGIREYSEHSRTELLKAFTDFPDRKVDEASGAAARGERIFVVDDEEAGVFEYHYKGGDRADFRGEYEILTGKETKFVRKCELPDPEAKAGKKSDCDGPEARVGKKLEIDDLEAVADYNNKLYLVTSHSLGKNGKRKTGRELFLEIDRLDPLGEGVKSPKAWVSRAAPLTACIEAALARDGGSRFADDGGFNIEGLAIDDEGKVYLGLRNPLMGEDKRAVVLMTSVEAIFSESTTQKDALLRVALLPLRDSDKDYGIVGLEYDRQSKAVLVLGNSPYAPSVVGQSADKPAFFPPKMWAWYPNDRDDKQSVAQGDRGGPQSVSSVKWSLNLPKEIWAKPETLVLPAALPKGLIFIDALGFGGQRKFSRESLGLRGSGNGH
jgi:hypothetical protein